jgi:hypothetical protein
MPGRAHPQPIRPASEKPRVDRMAIEIFDHESRSRRRFRRVSDGTTWVVDR